MAQRVVGVAQVDAENDAARDDVAAVGVHLHPAHGAAPMRRVAVRAGHHFLHQLRGHLQRVLAQRHGRGPGVGFHALHGAVVPADAQHTRHHTDGLVVVFQHRALFDVGLKVGAHGVFTGHFGADAADARQLVSHALAFGVDGGIGVFQAEGFGKNARAHHHGHKPRAFFVGPKDHFNGRFGLHARVVQCAHHFQPCQHAVVAIKFATGGLGVDVAAGDDGRQRVVAARSAHEGVADLVDSDAHSRLGCPLAHKLTRLLVCVSQGQTANPTFGRFAQACQRHQ